MENPIKKLFLFVFFIFALNAEEAERQNGFIGAIGIRIDYKYHKADSSVVSGAITSLQGFIGWNWKDYVKMEFSGRLGAGSNNIKGDYPIGTQTQLSRLTFKGGAFLDIDFEGKVGYNTLSSLKMWDNALFFNIGTNVDISTHYATYTPFATQLSLINAFVELEGRSAINTHFSFDYFARGIVGIDIISIGGSDLLVSPLPASVLALGGKVGVGFRYKIGEKAYFFMRLVGTYYNIAKSPTANIAITSNPHTNELIPNAKSSFAYPKSHTLYGGLYFGIGI